jgi:hypothetical protein
LSPPLIQKKSRLPLFLLLSLPAARLTMDESIRQTHVFILAFLRAQSLPKATSALSKELSKATPGAGTELEKESLARSGNELVAFVRAKLEMEKEKR